MMTRRELLGAVMLPAAMQGVESLEAVWRGIAAGIDGTVGAAALHLETGKAAYLNANGQFPLASVCKLPIAMHIFALADERKLKLDAEIPVEERDLWPPVSPIAEAWPGKRAHKLDQIVSYMVAQSDNTAVEMLYRMGGGAPALAARFRQWGISGVRIDRSERECMADARKGLRKFAEDPRDTGTPRGTVDLLAKLYQGRLLSASSTKRMIQILESTTTGPKRLKGLLPPGSVVGHKTGTTGDDGAFNAGTNDVGVINLPQGRLAIAVYVKGSTRNLVRRERIIAEIAKAAFAEYAGAA